MIDIQTNTKKRYMDLSSSNIAGLEYIAHLGYPTPDGNTKSKKTEIQFTNMDEISLFNKGKIKPEDMWKYQINEYGFRGDWNLNPTKKKRIAFFGDSFTFGDGLPEEEIFPTAMKTLSGEQIFNVGLGGSCVERITRTFSIFTKYVKTDIAIVTIPNIYREFFVYDGKAVDLNPQHRNATKQEKSILKTFLQLDDSYQLRKLSLNINYILDLAEARNIRILFSSWEIHTYNLLHSICEPDTTDIFPILDHRCARDLSHPGKESHYQYAKNLFTEIKTRNWI